METRIEDKKIEYRRLEEKVAEDNIAVTATVTIVSLLEVPRKLTS